MCVNPKFPKITKLKAYSILLRVIDIWLELTSDLKQYFGIRKKSALFTKGGKKKKNRFESFGQQRMRGVSQSCGAENENFFKKLGVLVKSFSFAH